MQSLEQIGIKRTARKKEEEKKENENCTTSILMSGGVCKSLKHRRSLHYSTSHSFWCLWSNLYHEEWWSSVLLHDRDSACSLIRSKAQAGCCQVASCCYCNWHQSSWKFEIKLRSAVSSLSDLFHALHLVLIPWAHIFICWSPNSPGAFPGCQHALSKEPSPALLQLPAASAHRHRGSSTASNPAARDTYVLNNCLSSAGVSQESSLKIFCGHFKSRLWGTRDSGCWAR